MAVGRPLSGKTAPKGRSRVSLIERFGGTITPASTSIPEKEPTLSQQMGPVVAPKKKIKKVATKKAVAKPEENPVVAPKKKIERVATKKAVAKPEESPVVATTKPNSDKDRSRNQMAKQKTAADIGSLIAAKIASNRANKP